MFIHAFDRASLSNLFWNFSFYLYESRLFDRIEYIKTFSSVDLVCCAVDLLFISLLNLGFHLIMMGSVMPFSPFPSPLPLFTFVYLQNRWNTSPIYIGSYGYHVRHYHSVTKYLFL